MPLSIEQIKDSVGKKFLGWITDNSGSNVAAAPKGVNLQTQNGDQVADLAVSLDGEHVNIATGATDNTAAAGQIFPAAGIYQSTADLVDSGDVGRVRMTSRRGLMTACDYLVLSLTASNPVPSGSDILGAGGGALTAADFDIRDTANHYYNIPMRAGGWRTFAARFIVAPAFDANIDINVYMGSAASSESFLVISGLTVSSGADVTMMFTSAMPGDSIGIVAASDPISDKAVYHYPALATLGYVMFRLKASAAPTSGTIKLQIDRGT